MEIPLRHIRRHHAREHAADGNHRRGMRADDNRAVRGGLRIAVGDDSRERNRAAVVQVVDGLAVRGGDDRRALREGREEREEEGERRGGGVREARGAIPFAAVGIVSDYGLCGFAKGLEKDCSGKRQRGRRHTPVLGHISAAPFVPDAPPRA